MCVCVCVCVCEFACALFFFVKGSLRVSNFLWLGFEAEGSKGSLPDDFETIELKPLGFRASGLEC